MADENKEWQRLFVGLRNGDRQMTQEFLRQYGDPLEKLAERNLPKAVRGRVGPEDIMQSTCRTFFRRVSGGEFRLEDSADLWRLLCAITLAKVHEQTRFHRRKKRAVEREKSLAACDSNESKTTFEPADDSVSPPDAAAFNDQFRKLVSSLDVAEQQVLDLKLQDYTNDDVANRIGSSERTVRRILKRIQVQLGSVFELAIASEIEPKPAE
jgi:RNA polymerase sigma-70 factor, ECF subfamily